MLRFLADESCDFAAVRALRTEGFDVLSVAEAMAGADDESVIALALRRYARAEFCSPKTRISGNLCSRRAPRALASC
jgi:hypothetical protein